uniref:Elongator complex protein 4 n=1 Tax=Romanomermis culicivorax TaxID=13658 RepID=A0A915HT99_ROMCU
MTSKFPFISGCKISTNNRGLVTFSGVPAVDTLLNGGLVVGSLCLYIDEIGDYSQYFTKCFAAEGLASSQSVYAAGYFENSQLFSETLPELCEDISKNRLPVEPLPCNRDILDDLSSIAWRYKNLPIVDTTVEQQNLSSTRSFSRKNVMDKSFLAKCDFSEYEFDFSQPICHYLEVLRYLKQKLSDDRYNLTSAGPKNLLRIVLMNLESPLWHINGKMLNFVFAVKCLIREKSAVVLISFSDNAIRPDVAKRIVHHCDVVFKLKALFKGNSMKIGKFYEGYKGLIYVEKLPLVNCLHFSVPDCLDLAFKWKKESLVIEKLHTPPDIDESGDNKSQILYTMSMSASGCASNMSNSKLDF